LNESLWKSEQLKNGLFHIITGYNLVLSDCLQNLSCLFSLDNQAIGDINHCIDFDSSAYHSMQLSSEVIESTATEQFCQQYYQSEQWLIFNLSQEVIEKNYSDLTSQFGKETIIDRVVLLIHSNRDCCETTCSQNFLYSQDTDLKKKKILNCMKILVLVLILLSKKIQTIT
jgi:hypothetical protein